ncbi:neuroepithelial cell-transforming gene 1 protein-like isoform X2 [Tachypleus tridentatus]|uniref:neuroepithelial cell-transforming gene 1 protein-like isoform X2 n=1 Tax=Tachypleus tridentatus TaxID=6853 RepID=UPI003FD54D95
MFEDISTNPIEMSHVSDILYKEDRSQFLEPPRKSRCFQFRSEESKLKQKKRLGSFGSLASLLSPAKPVKRVGKIIQRSVSTFNVASSNISIAASPTLMLRNKNSGKLCKRNIENTASFLTPYKQPKVTPRKFRSRQWLDTFSQEKAKEMKENMNPKDLKHQEAIFELYQGEDDMVEDLKLVLQTYRHSLFQLGILSSEELGWIFGPMDKILSLHEALLDSLKERKKEDGAITSLGQIMQKWYPGLEAYVSYCSNQIYAKALLEEKKAHDCRFDDFLQRCLESPFSRKLDLWNFLDVPRTRLVKYPLLLKAILKHTPQSHEDREYLPDVIKQINNIIELVDRKTGEANCQFITTKLDFLDERQRDPLIQKAKSLLCSGILKNNRGTKLHVFLFDTGVLLTRSATRWSSNSSMATSKINTTRYQVYREPIPIHQLVVENIRNGEVRMGGSFRSAFSSTDGAKHVFRLSFADKNLGQSHTLQASDEHDKKQWLQNLNKLINGHWLASTSGMKVRV